jgi:hypothetical protein
MKLRGMLIFFTCPFRFFRIRRDKYIIGTGWIKLRNSSNVPPLLLSTGMALFVILNMQ